MSIDNGVEFDCELIPLDGRDASESVQTHIVLTQMPPGLVELEVSSPQTLQEQYQSLLGTYAFYKTDGENIKGTVPAKLGNKITMAGLIDALSPYVFDPIIMTTKEYFKNYPNAELCETEVIRQDEQNRCLEYAFDLDNLYMECKYWLTDDGNVLVVLLIHNDIYDLPQNLRFLKFNRKEGTLCQLPTALPDNWPIGGQDPEESVRYRLKCDLDGIEALVPQSNGDGFDITTLKFDGQLFVPIDFSEFSEGEGAFDFEKYRQEMVDQAEANLTSRKSLDDIKLKSYALIDIDKDGRSEVWVRDDGGQDYQGIYAITPEDEVILIQNSDAISELVFFPNAVSSQGYREGEILEFVQIVKDSKPTGYCSKRLLIDNNSNEQEVVEEDYNINGESVSKAEYEAFYKKLGEPYVPEVKWNSCP